MRRSQLTGLVLVGAAAATVAKGVWLRRRLHGLTVLADPDPGRDPGPGPGLSSGPDHEFTVMSAEGVTVDAMTRGAAVRHARDHDLDVVDLVPGDLPVGALTPLLLQIDPSTYRGDPLAVGRGAGHAAVVRTALLDRLEPGWGGDPEVRADATGEAPDPHPGKQRRSAGLDPVAYLELSRRLKRYAPTATDLVVAPRLPALEPDPAWRLPHLRALAGVAAPGLAPLPAVAAVLAALAPLAHPVAGSLALVAYAVEPLVVGRGHRWVRPRGLRAVDLLARPGRAVADAVRPLVTPPPPAVRAHRDTLAATDRERRARYATEAASSATFFEAPRATCPWCGADEIDRLLTVPDLFQGKAGTFRLDECRACAHVFQNPRLSLAGLDHYYRDFYDGLQREHTELMFSFAGPSYRDRARMLRGVAEPKRWLDVGTGHGYFCLAARQQWPDTRFDGLDLTPNVVEAQRRGWVETGYHALFPDVASDLTGHYDVVSMHHYLEHTREPAAELDAARVVLESGGHLLVEVPAPESALGRRLGWLWGPWLQPQHQHFVPLANLTAALETRGFTVVATERGTVHQPVDLSYAVMLLAMRLAPAGTAPWDPPPTVRRRVARAATYAALLPLAGAAVVADHALVPLVRRRPQLSNAYRVLARKD